MNGLPAILQIADRRCVIVGGGGVATRRATALLAADANVTVIAPEVCDALKESPATIEQRPYKQGDLHDAFLVVIATDRPEVNEQVHADARAAGALVNRADDPEAGDFVVPAHTGDGPLMIAVYTDGVSPVAAATIRREITEALDPDWPRLLEIAADWRKRILAEVADPAKRRAVLTRIADRTALELLKNEGRQAVDKRCGDLLSGRDSTDE